MTRVTPTLPPSEPFEHPKYKCEPLHPLELLPSCSVLPPLPSPPRKSLLEDRYTLSTHIVPSAYPRSTPFLHLPPAPHWSPDKDVFKASVKKTVDAVVAIKEGQCYGEFDNLPPNRTQMWNCVNRYVRRGLRDNDSSNVGVTLFCAHAIGFHKETWEPLLERLVAGHVAKANYDVDEIWSWDAANHGDSCLINRESLGGLYDWRDNSRDILQFLLHYIPAFASSEPLPTYLSQICENETVTRRRHGLQGRKVVFIGHSFGGFSLVRAALEHPVLFRSLYMMDAMIRPRLEPEGSPLTTKPILKYVIGGVQRRDGWSSRDEAWRYFSSTSSLQSWDPESIRVYADCALYDAPDGQVRLKMPGVHEAVCYAEEYASSEAFEMLAQLDERIEVRWLIAAKTSTLERKMHQMVAWRRPRNSTHCLIQSGHLIPQEAPSEVARDLHEFLSSIYGNRRAML